jgi:hypothetical protein
LRCHKTRDVEGKIRGAERRREEKRREEGGQRKEEQPSAAPEEAACVDREEARATSTCVVPRHAMDATIDRRI